MLGELDEPSSHNRRRPAPHKLPVDWLPPALESVKTLYQAAHGVGFQVLAAYTDFQISSLLHYFASEKSSTAQITRNGI